jgi:hypothetical protein
MLYKLISPGSQRLANLKNELRVCPTMYCISKSMLYSYFSLIFSSDVLQRRGRTHGFNCKASDGSIQYIRVSSRTSVSPLASDFFSISYCLFSLESLSVLPIPILYLRFLRVGRSDGSTNISLIIMQDSVRSYYVASAVDPVRRNVSIHKSLSPNARAD